jgi:hypothetical protein
LNLLEGVVIVEFTLPSQGDQPKEPDVQVAHGRRPRGSGTGSDTAIAWGIGSGLVPTLKSRNPKVPSRLQRSSDPPQSGQAFTYAAAAGVKRSRQWRQQVVMK